MSDDYNVEGDYDPECKCGHRMHWHTSTSGPCVEPKGCNCRSFIKHDFELDVQTLKPPLGYTK